MTAAPSGAGATTSAAPEPSDGKGQPPVLRLGELQPRLRQIGFYSGAVHGDYDREVRVVLGDESGVYGRTTRAAPESDTPEP